MLKIAFILAISALMPVFAADTCRLATTAEFDALPGKAKFLQLVTQDYGGRAPTYHEVNSADTKPENQGQLCMGSGPFQAAPASAGDMQCSTQISNFGGDYSGGEGGTGIITAMLQSGYSVAGQWSTTTSTAVGRDMSAAINVAIPGLGGVDATFTTTFTATNTQASSTTSTVNQLQTFSATANVPKGATCSMVVNVTTCTINTSVQVPIVFSGYVKNHFDRAVTYTGQGTDNKAEDWWVNPAHFSMDPADMTGTMIVDGSLQSTGYGQAYVTCTGGDAGTGNTTTAATTKAATKRNSGPVRLRY